MTEELDKSLDMSAQGRTPAGDRVVYLLPLDSLAPDPASERSLLWMGQEAWAGRWWIALVTVLVFAAAGAYLLLAPKVYRAEALLSPASSFDKEGLGGSLGGLASLAGIDIGQGNTAEPVAVLKSTGFARDFVADNDLLHQLYASQWDATAGHWRSGWLSGTPDLADAVRRFKRAVLRVEEDKKTGLVTLAIEWRDPTLAAEWANLMVAGLNSRMRERAIGESSANLEYLQKQLVATTLVEMREPIGRLIESEMQKLMMAQGRKEFAFRVLDAAAVPKWPTRPRRLLTLGLAAMLGPLLGLAFVLLRSVQREAPGRRQRHIGS